MGREESNQTNKQINQSNDLFKLEVKKGIQINKYLGWIHINYLLFIIYVH